MEKTTINDNRITTSSEVNVRLKIPDTELFLMTRLAGNGDGNMYPEMIRFAQHLEDKYPDYKSEYEAKGWESLSEDLIKMGSNYFHVARLAEVKFPLTEFPWFKIPIESEPARSWKLFYDTEYVLWNPARAAKPLQLASTPPYPGRLHRSFLIVSNTYQDPRGPPHWIHLGKHDEEPRFRWGNTFRFQLVSRSRNASSSNNKKGDGGLPSKNDGGLSSDDDGGLSSDDDGGLSSDDDGEGGGGQIRNGDRVKLQMMDVSAPGKDPLIRGYVSRQIPDKKESFDWQYCLGTEQYTEELGLEPLEFEIEIEVPDMLHK